MTELTLWGFDGSTYVRTVKMLLAEKGVSGYRQVPLDVLKGEPKEPEHLRRHPFGKVPVVDVDGLRLIETTAICRYLDDVLPGRSMVPDGPADRARMDMAMAVTDSYGYGALIGVAGFHLFPDFIGGRNEDARRAGIATGTKVIEFAMAQKGASDFIAGALSLADLLLAPIVAYLAMTPDFAACTGAPGFADWWARMEALPSFAATPPM